MRATEVLQALTPVERAELDRLLAGYDPRPKTFAAFVQQARPTFVWYQHAKLIGGLIDRMVRGELKRLMVFCEPQIGKSETISRLGAAYFLRTHPDQWVGLASYSANLAFQHSRGARDYYGATSEVSKDRRGVELWETGHGGGMWAAGLGGSMTGKGMSLGIIDDPVKDAQEAKSEVIQARNQDWYETTFVSRASQDAAILLVMTRWDERDLAGWLLAKAATGEGEPWTVVHLEAVTERTPTEIARLYPPNTVLVPDYRVTRGVACCPERYPLDKLEARRREVGSYVWNAMYQQWPTPREGGMFQRSWFPIVDQAGEDGQTVRYWDQAATQNDGDYTVGVKVRRHKNGTYTILDVQRGQWSSGLRDKHLRATAEADGRLVRQHGEQEPGASGKDAALAFLRLLAGLPAHIAPASGDKELRAQPLAAAAEAGLVRVLRAPWNERLLEELVGFPHGAHDDQVDAASGAFNALASMSRAVTHDPGAGLVSANWMADA